MVRLPGNDYAKVKNVKVRFEIGVFLLKSSESPYFQQENQDVNNVTNQLKIKTDGHSHLVWLQISPSGIVAQAIGNDICKEENDFKRLQKSK